jgi:hypothetical protein
MDSIRDLLEAARTNNLVTGRFRGLLHIAIGRTITATDGTKLSTGVTWRALATILRTLRYDPEYGREVGADPETLSPRDRERYWYAVIALAQVDSAAAYAEAEKLIAPLKSAGFVVAPSATGAPIETNKVKSTPPAKVEKKTEKPAKEDEKPKKKKK